MGFYGGAVPDIPVPVELVAFGAAVENCDVRLIWTTETESNKHGFVIERSAGDKSFEDVAFVKGQGTTLERQNCAYVDEKLLPGN